MKKIVVFFVLVVAIAFAGSGQGHILPMPLHPELVEELRASGELTTVVEAWKAFAEQTEVFYSLPAPATPITSGSGIAILVDFEDNEADTVNHHPGAYDTLLFSVGEVSTGSMKDFYIENSYGVFSFTGQVSPHPDSADAWHRLAGSYDYWSQNYGFSHSQQMVDAAVAAADPFVDFAEFDNDGPDGEPNSGDDDGNVDAVYVVHAGPGYEENHCGKIWSHMSVTDYTTNDNSTNGGKIKVRRYSIQPEEKCDESLVHMGVFAHEYGHILGLPDLYDYDYNSSGVGRWSLMAAGSWNNSGRSPAHFDAWCKSKLGWVQPERVTDYHTRAVIPAVETSPVVYRLWTDGDTVLQQYFLVENRQKVGLFDSYLPGEGVMIYHVDDFKRSNDQEYIPGEHAWLHHYRVAVEQADGRFDLERDANNGDTGDPFPGSSDRYEIAGFLPYPTTRDYLEQDTKVGVLSISESADTMYADLDVGRHLPYFKLISVRQSSPDGRIKPGGQGSIIVTLENIWGQGHDVQLELVITHPDITVTQNYSSLGGVDEDETVTNISDPFKVSLSSEAPGFIQTTADLYIRDLSTGSEQHFQPHLVFGWPGVLVVDDAENEQFVGKYVEVLDDLGVPHEVLTSVDLSAVEDLILGQGTRDSVLIWFTGLEESTLDTDEQNLVDDFLESGGKLIISSQNLGEDIGSSGFYASSLHAVYQKANEEEMIVYGAPDNPITNPAERIAVSASFGNSKDGIQAAEGASAIFLYEDGNAGGLIYEGGSSQLAYLAFPFEGVTGNPNMFITSQELMRRLLTWFGYEIGISENAPESLEAGLSTLTPVVRRGESVKLLIWIRGEVEFTIYDATGRQVYQTGFFVEAESNVVGIPTRGLPTGVYFVNVSAENTHSQTRFIVLQ